MMSFGGHCTMKFYTYYLAFCPGVCDYEKEQLCPGIFDEKSGKQMTADFCLPHKTGECINLCPIPCSYPDQLCVGKMDPNGCPMPDMCFSDNGKYYYNNFLKPQGKYSKQQLQLMVTTVTTPYTLFVIGVLNGHCLKMANLEKATFENGQYNNVHKTKSHMSQK